MDVRLEYLKPHEVDAAQAACPTLYCPLGTIEWHGLQNVLGVDAVKAHALCVQAAQRGGGLVHPALYGAVGGLDQPHTFIFDPENTLFTRLYRPWIEKLCEEAKRNGFKAIVLLTGHYGAAQQIAVRETAIRMTKALGIPVLGTPEYFLALDEQYYGDHAAFFETSIMMHLFPDKVDLSLLGDPPHQGVHGRDPKAHATAAEGKRFCEAIVKRLETLGRAMPAWDEATRQRFLDAETALLDRQMTLASSSDNIWEGWRNIGKGVLDDYPAALAEERFENIIAISEAL